MIRQSSSMEMQVGEFLCRRLFEAGCQHIFGVPGDFCLGFFHQILKSPITYVGTCNELNAAYAADGYARIRGLGCVATTYVVGELSAVNGVAGAFAESVPVIAVTGTPTTAHYATRPLLHHTLGDYDIPAKMYAHITVLTVKLDNPLLACRQIDEAISVCLKEQKPVYICLPSDVAQETISVPLAPFGIPPVPQSYQVAMDEAVLEILNRLHLARNPLLIPGVEIARRNLRQEFKDFAENSRIPYVTMMLSKCILDESSPLFIGLFNGNRSREAVLQKVKESDCIIIFGEKLTDFNTGGFTAVLDNRSTIYVGYNFVRISYHTYHDVYIHDVLRELAGRISHFKTAASTLEFQPAKETCTIRPVSPFNVVPDSKLTMARFFHRLSQILKPNGTVIAETGSSLFSACETHMPDGTLFMGQTFYGSIGYTVGATLGACMADPNRPTYLLVGDGSFQVTAQDLSTMIRYKCSPLVFLINNDGYTIERVIIDHEFNDIQMWKYHKLPEVFGGREGVVVRTEGELDAALEEAEKYIGKELFFIEVVFDRWDCSELLKKAGEMMAKNNKLK